MNKNEPPYSKEQKKEAAGWGVQIFIIALFTSFFTAGIGMIVGMVISLISLFFPRYRHIFVGFILSFLVTAGLGLLVSVIFCSRI